MSANFAPNQANGCGASYDVVVYWPQSCDRVAAEHFPALHKSGVIKKEITILDGGETMTISLMPSGQGCVSIKKEVIP